MNGDQEATAEEQGADSGTRSDYERSTISFPYFDLAEAKRIAVAMSKNVGAGDAAEEQSASYIELSPKSSGYRGRVAAARLFGLLRQSQGGAYQRAISSENPNAD